MTFLKINLTTAVARLSWLCEKLWKYNPHCNAIRQRISTTIVGIDFGWDDLIVQKVAASYLIFDLILVNILTIGFGVSIGWSSASLLLLEHVDSPLPSGPLTKLQSSWVGSLMPLGGFTGNILCGLFAGRFGRKTVAMTAGVSQFVRQLHLYIYIFVSCIKASFPALVRMASVVYCAERLLSIRWEIHAGSLRCMCLRSSTNICSWDIR